MWSSGWRIGHVGRWAPARESEAEGLPRMCLHLLPSPRAASGALHGANGSRAQRRADRLHCRLREQSSRTMFDYVFRIAYRGWSHKSNVRHSLSRRVNYTVCASNIHTANLRRRRVRGRRPSGEHCASGSGARGSSRREARDSCALAGDDTPPTLPQPRARARTTRKCRRSSLMQFILKMIKLLVNRL